MSRKTNILVAVTSFLGGLTTGLLLAPRKGSQSRIWISNQATDLTQWVDTKHRTARYMSNRKLRKFRHKVKRGIQQNIPNLFEATENIDLGKYEISSG